MTPTEVHVNTKDMAQFWEECVAILKLMPKKWDQDYFFGDRLTQIHFYQAPNPFFTRAIAHLEVAEVGAPPHFHIHVIEAIDNGIRFPQAFFQKYKDFINQTCVVMSEDAQYHLYTYFSTNDIQFQIINKNTGEAIVWCVSSQYLPPWEDTFPFRQILYAFFVGSEYCPIHAAGLGLNGTGVMLTAKGGSGKSTAALTCLQAGFEYLGDDFVLFNTRTLEMHSLYNVAKVEPHQLTFFKHLSTEWGAVNLPQEKQKVFLYPGYQKQLVRKMKVKAILIPKYDANCNDSVLTACSVSEVLLAMAPSTMFLLRADNRLFRQLAEVCKSLPVYRFRTSSCLDSISEALKEFL